MDYKLDKLYGCWLWTGPTDKQGYALKNGRRAHRQVYVEHRGPIAPGLELDHTCRRRACVRPEHLEPVTRSENERRKSHRRRMRRSRCAAGHSYWDHGRTTRQGGKVCLVCAPI